MYNLSVSERVDRALDRTVEYIKFDLDMPQAASNLADKVHECYLRLKENPFMYAECFDPRLKKEGYRRAIVKNYILLFKIYEEQNLVGVHHFFHCSQDYVNLV
jgi:hypothetical protein